MIIEGDGLVTTLKRISAKDSLFSGYSSGYSSSLVSACWDCKENLCATNLVHKAKMKS